MQRGSYATQSYGDGPSVPSHDHLRRAPRSANYPSATAGTPTGRASPPAVNLDAWKVSSQLGTAQTDSIEALSELLRRSDAAEATDKGNGAESEAEQQQQQARPTADVAAAASTPSSSALPSAPMTSSSDLLSWLESVKLATRSSSSSAAAPHRQSALSGQSAYLEEINTYTRHITDLLDQLEVARVNVAELKAGARLVEETSEELRDESERRGGSQQSLLTLVEAVEDYLSYYALLPQATSFLSSPNLSIVLSPTFSLTMSQLDIGLTFILAHPHFMDATLHRLRFEHCIMRGGTLAKLWVCNKLRDLKNDAVDKLRLRGKQKADSSGEDTENAEDLHDFASPELLRIISSRFVAAAPELQSILVEIQKHCPAAATDKEATSSKAPPQDEESLLADYSIDDDKKEQQPKSSSSPPTPTPTTNTFPEFATLLADCRNAYFDARRSILGPLLSTVLTRIENRAQSDASTSSSTSPLHLFARRALVVVKSVLMSETILYQQIFGQGATSSTDTTSRTALVEHLKTLSKDLFDRLHPRIFAESRLSSLCAIAGIILDAANVKEASSSQGASSRSPLRDTDAYLLLSLDDPHYPEARPYFVGNAIDHTTSILQPLITPLMDDALTRTTFRARAVINGADIAGYTPPRSAAEATDDPFALVKQVVGRTGGEKTGRKSLRGRSSLGVGVLEAAAKRALDDGDDGDDGDGDDRHKQTDSTTSIDLFSLPSKETLQTWYTPLTRLFRILSLLHPVLSRSAFAQIGAESISKMQDVIKNATNALRSSVEAAAKKTTTDANAYQPDALDVHLFALHHTLLLREVSASVDLSLIQLSTLDGINECIRASLRAGGVGAGAGSQSAQNAGAAAALNLGVVYRIFGTLLDGMGIASTLPARGGDEGAETAPPAAAAASSQPITIELQRVTTLLVDAFVAERLATFPHGDDQRRRAFIEECVVQIRQFRRRITLWIKDEEIVQGIVTGVVASIGGDGGGNDAQQSADDVEDVQAEILDRLGLAGGETNGA